MSLSLNVFVFIFGAIIGSFLNALIYRIPNEISIATPRSRCPHCSKLISWFENIPIVSFLFLRGKCSGCHNPIGIRYPLVELMVGLFSFYFFPKSLDPMLLSKFLLKLSIFSCFVVHFFIDVKHKILPNSVNIYLAIVLLTLAFLEFNWRHIFLGGAIGLLFPLTITWLFYILRGQIGLGGGDIKLYGALGLYLGPVGIIYNLFLSCFVGAFFSLLLIALKKMTKDNPIAFGPFILLVAFAQIFFPREFFSFLKLFFVVP